MDICTVCEALADNNYTLHTFDLILTRTGYSPVNVGNVVAGNIAEDVQFEDSFDPLGLDESPRITAIRNAVTIELEFDEYTAENLALALDEEITYYNSVNCQINLTHVKQQTVYGATLIHTMPSGVIIRLVFRRASITSPFEMPFSEDWSRSPMLLRSLYDKTSPGSPFGYLQIEPCREVPGS